MKYYIIAGGILLIVFIGLIATSGSDTASQQLTPEDMQGIHIMPDGAVMSGGGDIIDGATIRPDGQIVLPDGQIITPSRDFRK